MVPGMLTHSAIAPTLGQRAGHDRAAGGHHATALCVLARVVLHLCHKMALQRVRRGKAMVLVALPWAQSALLRAG